MAPTLFDSGRATRLALVPYLVGFLILSNHYCRDTIGTLQKQLMADIPMESHQYALLNTFYFLPNIFLPLIAGVFLKKEFVTVQQLMVACLSVACASNFIFAVGCSVRSYPLLFLGRMCCGIVYELIDMTPIIFLNRMYAKNWSFVCGIINSFLRLGSVATFLISPLLYTSNGLGSVMYFSACVSALGVFAGYLAVTYEGAMHADSLGIEEGQGATADADSVDTGKGATGLGLGATYSVLHRVSNSSFSIDDDEEEGDEAATAPQQDSASPYSRGPGVELTARPLPGDTRQSVARTGAVVDAVVDYLSSLPALFSRQFYFYVLTGTFLYGSMVPFWFTGSKFLQEAYGLDVVSADWLVLLPEGTMVFISMPLGLFLERRRGSIQLFHKLIALSVVIFTVALAYIILAYGFRRASDASADQTNETVVPPAATMLLVGVSYGFSNCLFWSCITDVIPKAQLAEGTGVIASAMNVLPCVMPLVVSYLNSHFLSRYTATSNELYNLGVEGGVDLCVLAMAGVVSAIFCLCAGLSDDLQSGSSASN